MRRVVRGARGSRRGADRSAALPAEAARGAAPGRGSRATTRPSSAPSGPAPIHTRSPLAHSASRSTGRNPRTRAGRTSCSRIDAGTAAPCRRAIASISASGPVDGGTSPCHAGRNRPSVDGVDRLDLLAERGERPATEPAEHVDVAPFAFDAAAAVRGAELAVRDASARLQRVERGAHAIHAGAQPGRRLAGEERRVRAGVPGDERLERTLRRLGEHPRQADRERDAERVAQRRGILHRGEALLTRDAHADRAPLREHPLDPRGRVLLGPRRDLARRSDRRRSPAGRGRRPRSAPVAPSARPCSSISSSSNAAGSSRSRSSSSPSSSRSRSRSSASAAARRSASGASPSYM